MTRQNGSSSSMLKSISFLRAATVRSVPSWAMSTALLHGQPADKAMSVRIMLPANSSLMRVRQPSGLSLFAFAACSSGDACGRSEIPCPIPRHMPSLQRAREPEQRLLAYRTRRGPAREQRPSMQLMRKLDFLDVVPPVENARVRHISQSAMYTFQAWC